jgi:hypothetical protein
MYTASSVLTNGKCRTGQYTTSIAATTDSDTQSAGPATMDGRVESPRTLRLRGSARRSGDAALARVRPWGRQNAARAVVGRVVEDVRRDDTGEGPGAAVEAVDATPAVHRRVTVMTAELLSVSAPPVTK